MKVCCLLSLISFCLSFLISVSIQESCDFLVVIVNIYVNMCVLLSRKGTLNSPRESRESKEKGDRKLELLLECCRPKC